MEIVNLKRVISLTEKRGCMNDKKQTKKKKIHEIFNK